MSDTLPQSNSPSPTSSPGGAPQPIGSMAKETGPNISFAEVPLTPEIGQEISLPSEVVKAGVTIQPTTVNIPPSMQGLGVKAVGAAAPAITVAPPPAPLPLSDDQIAQGLHQSLVSSWRWLAQWCTRQLKQVHIVVKQIHGKIIRTTG